MLIRNKNEILEAEIKVALVTKIRRALLKSRLYRFLLEAPSYYMICPHCGKKIYPVYAWFVVACHGCGESVRAVVPYNKE